MFKLQVISGLCLDVAAKGTVHIKQRAPYLALVGNVGPIRSLPVSKFLEENSRRYDKIFIVPSPREYGPRGYSPRIKPFDNLGNIHFLSRNTFTIDNKVKLFGVTGWSTQSGEDADVEEAERDEAWLQGILYFNRDPIPKILLSFSSPPHHYINQRLELPVALTKRLEEASIDYWIFGNPCPLTYLLSGNTKIIGPDYRESPILDRVITI